MKRTDIRRTIGALAMWMMFSVSFLGVMAQLIAVAPSFLTPLLTCIFLSGSLTLTYACYRFARYGSLVPRAEEEIAI